MDDYDLHLPYLERLSKNELVELAKRLGVDIPAGLDRLFIIEELLECAPCLNIYQEENGFSEQFLAASALAETDIPAPVELPKQYNLTYIEAIVRDPLWVFVYWEVRGADKTQLEKTAGFQGYLLKVSLFKCIADNSKSVQYTVSVAPDDTSWYLNFPPDNPCRRICNMVDGCSFRVELCAEINDEITVLAHTQSFTLPGVLGPSGEGNTMLRINPFIRLSGLDDLQVLRNGERTSRLWQH
ncbi:DUF4912 domain-containing protein [Spirochaetia bacterium]|nr:DUF4912 domain-containing protein [Spirochaetia bacterium]